MIEDLETLGLTKKESQLYKKLVDFGELSANELAKKTNTNRPLAYNILQQLMNKGFVKFTKKNGIRYYSITDPKSFLASIKEREEIAKDLIKKIEELRKVDNQKTLVETYEGFEGVKIIHEELRKAKNVKILNATGLIFENLKFTSKKILKDMESNKTQIIANEFVKDTALVEYKKMKIKYLSKELNNYATTFIYEGKIVIQVLKDFPVLIKIKNQEVFESYKNTFDFFWEKL